MSGGNSAVIGPESNIPMPEPALEAAHRRTRLILAVGLGGMILLMLAAGIDAVRVLQAIREQSDLIQADAAARTGTLVSIRTKLLLSDTFVRDYLMDPDENRSAEDNSELRRVWADLEQGLDTYAATPDANEAEMAARLRRKIERYWESISPSLRWSNRERRESGMAFYNSAVLPSRVSILEITTEIDDAHSRQAADGESRMAARFGDLRSELLWTFLLSLGAATILALGSAIYISRLERETRLRYDQVAAGRVEMGQAVPTPGRRPGAGKEVHFPRTARRSGTDAQRLAGGCRKPPKAHSGERCAEPGTAELDPAAGRHQRQRDPRYRPPAAAFDAGRSGFDGRDPMAGARSFPADRACGEGLGRGGSGRSARRSEHLSLPGGAGSAAKHCAPRSGQDGPDRTETGSWPAGAQRARRWSRI